MRDPRLTSPLISQRTRRAKSEEMVPTSVDKVLMEIASLRKDPYLTSQVKERIPTLEMELRFLKMFIWFLPRKSLKKSYIRATVGRGKLGIYDTRNLALDPDLAASKLLQKVELCKKKIGDDCIYFFDFSSQCKFSNSYELLRFINCTLSNLRSLVRLKGGAIVPVRMQVRALVKKLRMFRDFVKSTEEGFCFSICIQDWAYKTACLSTLYWVYQMEEAMAARMRAILTDLLQMVKSYTPAIIGLYIRALKASKISSFDTLKIGEVVASSVVFFLPIGFMKILREELIFLITFLMNPHPTERTMYGRDWHLLLIEAKAVASEIPSLICSLTVAEMNQETAQERNVLISDFKGKTDKVKAGVRKLLYALNPQSSGSNYPVKELYFQVRSHFPATNALGFIDCLLENLGNLKETSISLPSFLPFVRDQLVTLYEELVSVRAYLKHIQEMQNEFVELKNSLMQIVDAAYQVEHVIDSCQIFDVPTWYNVLCLSDVTEKIRQDKKIMDNQIYTDRVLNAKGSSCTIHLGQAYTSRLDEIVIGFEDEAETIIDRLTRGSRKLEIVPVVGMPGQGKTTLAKKVYNSPSIQRYFTKCAWCFVTQVYEYRMLLLDILRDVTTMLDDEICNMSQEDLAQKLYRCLKGQRYFIIMDDVWDIAAWNAVKESFPDDEKGSRILFTSRNKFFDNPHLLRPLSGEEGSELLKQKLFPEDGWPSNFSHNVQQILKVCNGLPLAVVVIAGMLKSVSNNLNQWSQIVQNLNTKLASEGCMDVLELSYKNLPDFLKPCFLYLGAQTKVFKVDKLIQLWIAEGFVRKSGIKSLEEVAREYLEDLTARSLVIVNRRSFSSGEIKECRIHDLLHEFCSTKAEEERFIHFSKPHYYSSETITYDQYRLCICCGWAFLSSAMSIGPNLRSLLILGNSCVPCPYQSTYPFFLRLMFLRVLDFGSLDFRNCFPEEALLLICLRYFSIKCQIEEVPWSIGNLCNLETFHVVREVGDGSVLQFPQTIWKMKTLRNVDVGRGAITFCDDDDANVCPQLGNLNSFSSLYLGKVKDAEKLLRGFPRIRKLKLEISEPWDCRRNCCQLQVLHSLSELESLNLQYSRHVAHTCALNFPTALKKLTLAGFRRPWSEISTIGKLSNLEVLKLLDSAIVGETWDVEDEEFLNLRYLKLSGLDISQWEASTSSFPCLERLVVRHCHFLVEFPSIFEEVLTLKMIEVRGCLKSLGTSADSICNEQRDTGNEDLEVLISNILDDYLILPRRLAPNECSTSGTLRILPRQLASNECSTSGTLRKNRLIISPRNLLVPPFGVKSIWNRLTIFPRFLCFLHFRGTSNYEISSWDKKVACETHEGVIACETHEGVIERSLAWVKKRLVPRVPGVRRTNLLLKHNCQPRQAIMSRHTKEERKRDG